MGSVYAILRIGSIVYFAVIEALDIALQTREWSI